MNLPSTDEIIEDLEFLDDWEQRYQYIIDLGKGLPGLPEALRKDEFIVRGCQSNVWLIAEQKDGRLLFQVDSDAVIVQGLLTLVLAAFHNKTPETPTRQLRVQRLSANAFFFFDPVDWLNYQILINIILNWIVF